MTRTFDLLALRSSGNTAVEKLFAKAHSHAWDVERDVPWHEKMAATAPLVGLRWAPYSHTAAFAALPKATRVRFTRRALAHTLQALLLGEAVAQEVCVRLATQSQWEDHRNHAVAQAMDEARHRMAYGRLLDMMAESPQDVEPETRALFDLVLATQDLTELVAWEQFYLESLAMNVMRGIHQQARHPALKQVFALNLRDEARHMGFGILYLQDHLATLDLEDQVAFARSWLGRVLALNFGGQDPFAQRRLTRWLYESGVEDSVAVAHHMQGEQNIISQQAFDDAAAGRLVPQELRSAQRIGLMRPEILEALGLQEHPLVKGTLRASPKAAP